MLCQRNALRKERIMIQVNIAAPCEWQDGMCESLETRTYMEAKASDIKVALQWVRRHIPHVMNLDPIHGNRFVVYFNHEYVGEIHKVTKTFEVNVKSLLCL